MRLSDDFSKPVHILHDRHQTAANIPPLISDFNTTTTIFHTPHTPHPARPRKTIEQSPTTTTATAEALPMAAPPPKVRCHTLILTPRLDNDEYPVLPETCQYRKDCPYTAG